MEDSGLFVVCAVATRRAVTKPTEKNVTVDATLAKLQELDAVVAIHYVRPFDGWAAKLMRKNDKMDTMARGTRLVMGSHEYLRGDTLVWRNVYWGFCVRQAAASAAIATLTKGPIEALDVVVDRKTMANPTRRLFDDQGEMMADYLQNAVKGLPGFDQRLRVTRSSVRFRLSDDPGTKDIRGGLVYADCLARAGWNAIRESGRVPFMEGRDRRDTVYDMTRVLLEPVSRDAIDGFKRRTGLPEPRAGDEL